MDLSDYRTKIDDIDTQIAKLLTERFDTVDAVGEYKRAHGMNVLVPSRERDVLDKVGTLVSKEYRLYTENIFSYIMAMSRVHEREKMGPCSNAVSRFITDSRPEKQSPRVAIRASEISVDAKVAAALCPGSVILSSNTFEQIFIDIRDGAADYGVLPFDGPGGFDPGIIYGLLLRYGFYIVRALPLKTDFYLLGVRGAKLSDVRIVCGRPIILQQCSQFFAENPRLKPLSRTDTAQSAEYVSRNGRHDIAVAAPREYARAYGFDVLSGPIPLSNNSATRYILVSRLPEFRSGADNISLTFKLPNVTGALYRTLMRFTLAGLNLTKILSLPCSDERDFEYRFFVDLKGNLECSTTMSLLSQLNDELPGFRLFGNYL
jgi:chorismate mutase/prephenate dehydratase